MDDHLPNGRVAAITHSSRLVLRRGVKLRRDPVRDRWVVLAPERILTPNEQAAEVLRLCDGHRTVGEIASLLANTYDAEPDTIAADIMPVLENLVDMGVLTA